jgi:EmrB/QacA subfamily drug resistance transporter
MAHPATPAETLTPGRRRLLLAVVGLALMAVISAVSGLNVALPSLALDTGATQTQLTWIVDAYTVVFAGLLLFAGALGDRYGRKLLLAIGLLIFGSAAALGLFVDEPGQLIVVRVLMGIGAAAIMPTTLSVITTSFPEEERPRAIGVWVGIAGGGAVIGLFVTGLLLEWFPWTSFFGLNVAFATVALIGTLVVVPGSVDEDPPELDVVGALLSLVAITAFVFGIIEGPSQGWSDPLTLGALVLGVVAGIAFVAWEWHQEKPLLDPRLFRLRGFSSGSLTITVQFLAAFGFFFVTLQYLQFVTGRSPLEAALALLPLPFILLPTARRAPVLMQRIGFRRLGPLGLVSMALGFLILSQLGVESSYWHFVLGLVFFGFGMGLAGTPATTAITSSLPMSKQGVASAWNDTSRELGSAFGIAILGSLLNQGYREGMAQAVTDLPAQLAERVLSSIAFTASPLVGMMGDVGDQLVLQARQAFVGGVGDAVLVASLILLVTAVVVAALAPRQTRVEGEAVAAEIPVVAEIPVTAGGEQASSHRLA